MKKSDKVKVSSVITSRPPWTLSTNEILRLAQKHAFTALTVKSLTAWALLSSLIAAIAHLSLALFTTLPTRDTRSDTTRWPLRLLTVAGA